MKLKRSFGFGLLDLEEVTPEIEYEVGEDGEFLLDEEGNKIPKAVVEEVTPEEEIEAITPLEDEIETNSDADIVEDAIDEVGEVGEGLEAYREMVLDFQANGGMNRQTALAVDMGIKNLTAKFNIGSGKGIGIALESFDEAGGKITATGYALEGIGEALKEVWEKVQAFIRNLITAIMAFFGNQQAKAKQLIAAAKKIAEAAKTASAAKAETTVELGADTIRNLSIGTNHTDYIKGLKELEEGIVKSGSILGPQVETMLAVASDIKKIDFSSTVNINAGFQGLKSGTHTADSLIAAIKSKYGFVDSTMGDYKDTETEKYAVSKPLLGNRCIVFAVSTNADGVVLNVSSKLVATDEKGDNITKLATLDSKKIIELANTVSGLAYRVLNDKRSNDYKKNVSTYNEAVRGVYSNSIKHIANLKGVDLMATRRIINGAGTVAASFAQPNKGFMEQGLSSAKAGLRYASESLKALSAKPTEAAA